MSNSADQLSRPIPLKPEEQKAISALELARLIMQLLRRNWTMAPAERVYKVSYYPFQLASLRAFEIVGHANPEDPGFAYKWNEAIAILRSKALIMVDPTQGNRDEFMVPTSIGLGCDLDRELGLTQVA